MVGKLFILILMAILVIPGGVFAFSETGGVENIFSYGAGLRALGMGAAFTAMTQDPTLAYWNPGSMPFNQYKEFSLFGTRSIADTYYFSGFYTNPTISLGTLSIGAMGIYTGGIQSYDENASPITTAASDYLHYQILLSYGYNFSFGLGVGTTAKVEQIRITDYKGTGASFDVGVFLNPPKIPWLAMGVVVQDVYGTGIRLATEYEENTRVYKAGLAANFKLGKNKKTRLSFSTDARVYMDNYNPGTKEIYYDFNFGHELSFADRLMFRVGYRGFTPESAFENFPQGVSLGLGIRQWGLGIDYAVSFEDPDWQGTAELLMRLGISYRFGKSIQEKKNIQAEKIKTQIEEGIREATKQYEQELEQLSAEYNREKERIILEMDEKYRERLATIDQTIEETRQDIIADLTAQFEAEKRRALEELTRQYEQQRAQLESQLARERTTFQQRIQSLETQFEQEKQTLRQQITADESFKSETYARGLQLLADGKYSEALTEFETVARYDPDYLKVQEYINLARGQMKDVSTYSPQIMELYYRGVDLFVQKNYEQAIQEWERILEIDPYNKLALRNIKEAQERLRKLKELGATE